MRKKKLIPVFKKKYKYLFKKMLDKELIRQAFIKMRKGKSKRKKIQIINANLDYYIDKMYESLKNSIPDGDNPELAFIPPIHKPIKIHEHGKDRLIYVPDIWEQWVHHIIMQVLAPICMKKFHYDSYGSIPNKGLHKGAKQFVKYKKKYKYAYKCDIRHFYANIRKDVLRKQLESFIDDDWFIELIMTCFTHHKKGLPLGFYLSQWLANVVLNDLDWMIEGSGLDHIRYVDDIVIFSNNKTKLYAVVKEIKQYLGRELRLSLKDGGKLINLDKEDISFLGFVFRGTTIRLRGKIKRNIIKIVHRIRKALDNKCPIWIKDARRILSALGWIEHSNSYAFYSVHIQPFIIVKKIKDIVSKNDKKERLFNYDSMDLRRIRPSAIAT